MINFLVLKILMILTLAPTHLMAAVPDDFQAIFFAKVIKYVRTPPPREPGRFELGLLYDPNNADSKQHYSELQGDFKKNLLQQKAGSLIFTVVELTPTNLDGAKVDGVYLCRGLNTEKLQELLKKIEQKRLLNFTAEEAYFNLGIMLGVKSSEGKTQILLNKKKADESGIDFDARFLQIAEMIK